eukprot:1159606-Pelagomonas_calceolata.AAC.10
MERGLSIGYASARARVLKGSNRNHTMQGREELHRGKQSTIIPKRTAEAPALQIESRISPSLCGENHAVLFYGWPTP